MKKLIERINEEIMNDNIIGYMKGQHGYLITIPTSQVKAGKVDVAVFTVSQLEDEINFWSN